MFYLSFLSKKDFLYSESLQIEYISSIIRKTKYRIAIPLLGKLIFKEFSNKIKKQTTIY